MGSEQKTHKRAEDPGQLRSVQGHLGEMESEASLLGGKTLTTGER